MIGCNLNQFSRVALLALVFLLPPTALAQATNPTAAACGLPESGIIVATVTYSLTADCALTGIIRTSDGDGTTQQTLTISGNGYTIDATAVGLALRLSPYFALNLNNATIVGGGRLGGGAIEWDSARGSSTLNTVTLRGASYTAMQFNSDNTPAVSHSLSNILIENAAGNYYSTWHGIPAGIHTIGPVDLAINNIVLRNLRGGNAAIGANDTYIIPDPGTVKGTITFTGCLTADGVFPRIYYGDIVDNSSGPCSGAAGNGGSSAIQYPQAPVSACGLPSGGFVYGSFTFNLKGDCRLSAPLYIPYESDVTINGNARVIDLSDGGTFILAGETRLNNAIVTGAADSSIYTHLDRELWISHVIFRRNAEPLVFQDSIATLSNVIIEDQSQAGRRPSAIYVFGSARVVIRDAIFRRNTGGAGVIDTWRSYQYGPDSVTWLEGCITFEDNSPVDISDPGGFLIDNRTGPCPPDWTILVKPSAPKNKDEDKDNWSASVKRPPLMLCGGAPGAIAMGSEACVFRHDEGGDSILQVYEIDRLTSEGFHQLTVAQSQVSSLEGENIVAVSADGRVLAVVWPDDNVTIKVGPNPEGKILHLTLEGSVMGRVLEFTATYGTAPGLPFINLALPLRILPGQASLPAQTSVSRLDCMVTTRDILNFRDGPAGNIKSLVPPFVTLTAIDRADGWFQVDNHGEAGWLSADYVTPKGNCG
ncbi:MAG: hypothetical protein OXT68_11020 [Chloroflexota bacterium]|nr:hypothetical protein [Chloroflexota bacterium]MDE2951285.1 hypothetical protein [Chloroflexota bacterium]